MGTLLPTTKQCRLAMVEIYQLSDFLGQQWWLQAVHPVFSSVGKYG
jgi:hypothetical protein